MTLQQLKCLLAIIDAELSMTVAAQRLNATQPGLSKQIKALEEELGFPIFVRRAKTLGSLTSAGEQVAERARIILGEAGNIRTIAENQRRETHGTLVIATTQTQVRFTLPLLLQRLNRRFPDVRVRINLFSSLDGKNLAMRDADIMIASAIEPPTTKDHVIPLYQWKRVAVMLPRHPLAKLSRPLTLQDLSAHPLIGYESALGSHSYIAKAFSNAGVPADFRYAIHDSEVIKTLVRLGLGVGLMAEMATTVLENDLVQRPIVGLPDCRAYAFLPKERVIRSYVEELLADISAGSHAKILRRDTRAMPPASPPDYHTWLAGIVK